MGFYARNLPFAKSSCEQGKFTFVSGSDDAPVGRTHDAPSTSQMDLRADYVYAVTRVAPCDLIHSSRI